MKADVDSLHCPNTSMGLDLWLGTKHGDFIEAVAAGVYWNYKLNSLFLTTVYYYLYQLT